jgi:deazaflavin-dependent oxidoreductase (nitroreductase family)
MRRLAAALVALALLVAAAPAADPAARLAAVAHESTLEITTTGRKTGKPHTVPVWFVVADDAVWLTTLDPSRDWVRNALHTPEVTLAVGDVRLRGRFAPVTDPATVARIAALRHAKYRLARIAAWFGYDATAVYRVDRLEPASP